MYPDGVRGCYGCGEPLVPFGLHSLCNACWNYACERLGFDPMNGLDKNGKDGYNRVIGYYKRAATRARKKTPD